VISSLLCPLCLHFPQGHAVEEHDDYEFTSARYVQWPVNNQPEYADARKPPAYHPDEYHSSESV
jgi:hypothetical protein